MSDLWEELGQAINDTANMAHMLACAAEERMGQDAQAIKDQREAIVYGAYRLEELAKAARDAYRALIEELHAQDRPRLEVAAVH